MDDPQALLQRRRIWGVPPDAVASALAACQREQADLRARIAALDVRLSYATAERDEAVASVAALNETVARLEAERAEWKDRPEAVRAEAIQFVVDAYAEAQQAREQAARDIAAERESAREAIAAERAALEAEIAAARRELEAERRTHEGEVAALQQQRTEAIAALDALSRGLLAQLGRVDPTAPVAPEPLGDRPSAMPADVAPDAALEAIPDVMPEPPAPTEPPVGPPAPATSDEIIPEAAAADARRPVSPEDAMLARALDELEAILRGNRKAEN